MSQPLLKFVVAALAVTPAAFAPSSARAGELSAGSSSGSITFTVVIPPIGAAIRAADSGAVGLWTITDATDGLMIKVNNQGKRPVLSLFHGGGSELTVHLSGKGGNVSFLHSANDGGLESEHYSLNGLQSGVNIFTLSGI